jgi:hypothetical protein
MLGDLYGQFERDKHGKLGVWEFTGLTGLRIEITRKPHIKGIRGSR